MLKNYIELVVALAIEKNNSPLVDLMMGLHPEEKRWLTEPEDLDQIIRLIKYTKIEDISADSQLYSTRQGAFLWLKYFPQIEHFLNITTDELYSKLWKIALHKQKVLHLAYIFYPDNCVKNHKEFKAVDAVAKRLQHQMVKALDNDTRAKSKVCWTRAFPAHSSIGEIIELKAGLSQDLKADIGLSANEPGLLCNYLLNRNKSVEEILSPYQFEELVSIIFSEEGWKVTLTQKSRDGGKDIIAQKEVDNKLTLAYIQAKRHLERNKVGIAKVKEFVATVAGDQVDTGYIVTTSYFSKPATEWLENKGGHIANIELIERTKLFRLMEDIATLRIPAYLKM